MIRNLLYISFILLLLFGCNSRQADKVEASPTQDSIQKYLDLAGNDSIAYDKRVKYNDKALSYIDLKRNDSLTRESIFKICINSSKIYDTPKVEKYSKILINKSNAIKDSTNLSNGFYSLGYCYMLQSKNELAIKYFFKAKKIFSLKGSISEEIKVMRNIATTQSYANDFLGSIKTSFQIIEKVKKHNLEKEINNSYLNIGNNLAYLKNERMAIKYYKKINFEEGESNFNCDSNNNIAISYMELGENQNAFFYIKKNFENKNFENLKPRIVAVTNSLLGLYYLKTNHPESCILFLKKADSIFKSEKTLNGQNYNHLYLSKYYESQNIISTSIKHAEKAVALSKEYKNANDILISLNQLITVDRANGSKNALEYIRINDSMQIAERNFRDKFARIAYETDEINQQKNNALKQRSIVAGIAFTLFVIIILLYIISRQRLKQKELKLIQAQQRANEEIYHLMLSQKNNEEEARESEKKRIALELHDGVMNRLASIRLNLSIIKRQKDDKTLEKCIEYVNDIYAVETEIRNITHNLSDSNSNPTYNFAKLLKEFIERQNDCQQIKYSIEIDSAIHWDDLSDIKKMNLYRIVQEASQNINKHSKATQAIISFLMDQKNICLSITDNGIGMKNSYQEKGIGLKNIKYRVTLLNGKLTINSQKNQNTSLNISFPIEK